MRASRLYALTFLTGLLLGGCAENPPTPDYRIKVMPHPAGQGSLAIPPECPSWTTYGAGDPLDNQPWPTYGCAQARNLAAQVERPEDLTEGRASSPADAVVSASTIARYRAGKTTPLIDPNANAPSQIVRMEDSRVGGGEEKK